MTYEIIIYQTEDGKEPFNKWLDNLDFQDQTRILKRLDRLKLGNFGDHKSIGGNIYELRFTYGGGYRAYYGIKDNKIVILLCGGNKKTQSKDIESAKQFWRDTMRTYRTLDQVIQERLSDPGKRAEYLDIAVEDYVENGDEAELLLAIRQVVQAGIGFAKLSEATGLSRESLYKTLSGKGNPKLKTLKEILSALGYSLYIKKQRA